MSNGLRDWLSIMGLAGELEINANMEGMYTPLGINDTEQFLAALNAPLRTTRDGDGLPNFTTYAGKIGMSRGVPEYLMHMFDVHITQRVRVGLHQHIGYPLEKISAGCANTLQHENGSTYRVDKKVEELRSPITAVVGCNFKAYPDLYMQVATCLDDLTWLEVFERFGPPDIESLCDTIYQSVMGSMKERFPNTGSPVDDLWDFLEAWQGDCFQASSDGSRPTNIRSVVEVYTYRRKEDLHPAARTRIDEHDGWFRSSIETLAQSGEEFGDELHQVVHHSSSNTYVGFWYLLQRTYGVWAEDLERLIAWARGVTSFDYGSVSGLGILLYFLKHHQTAQANPDNELETNVPEYVVTYVESLFIEEAKKAKKEIDQARRLGGFEHVIDTETATPPTDWTEMVAEQIANDTERQI